MTSEIIENIYLRKRHSSEHVTPVITLTSRKPSSVVPDWTELNSAPDVECAYCNLKCITLTDFGMMMGTILIGIMVSLAMLYVGVLVSPYLSLKSTLLLLY